MPKGKNKSKRKSAGEQILSTPKKKAAGIKREKLGLASPSPTPTPVAARKGALAAIPELYGFTMVEKVQRYETVASDSDSDSTSSVISAVFPVGGNSGRKGKEKEDNDGGSDNKLRFLIDTMREGLQEMVALCGEITDAEEGGMVGFLLPVVSNFCRMEPTQVVHSCCGLGDDCVAVGKHTIEMEAREVCSLPDDYEIMKSELDNKRQEVGDLEEDVQELKQTIGRLEGDLRFEKRLREEGQKNSGTKRVRLYGCL